MSLNLDKNLKKYYSIGEVAKMFGVAPTLLRYWETEFPSIQPRKSGRNVRQYSIEDIEEIRLIHNMVKVRGMKLSAVREAVAKNRNNENNTTDLIEHLQDIRAELVALRRELDSLA